LRCNRHDIAQSAQRVRDPAALTNTTTFIEQGSSPIPPPYDKQPIEGPARAKRRRASAPGSKRPARQRIGWREWVGLPDLGIEHIKAKVDTGARTSTLHAYHIVPFEQDGRTYVRFKVHPVQRRRLPEVECVAPVVARRSIRDSGGRAEERFIILTTLRIGEDHFEIELTLTNRDQMSFRMLVGRAAIRRRYHVDPGRSYRTGRPIRRRARQTEVKSKRSLRP
jgi:hypothetical protein